MLTVCRNLAKNFIKEDVKQIAVKLFYNGLDDIGLNQIVKEFSNKNQKYKELQSDFHAGWFRLKEKVLDLLEENAKLKKIFMI